MNVIIAHLTYGKHIWASTHPVHMKKTSQNICNSYSCDLEKTCNSQLLQTHIYNQVYGTCICILWEYILTWYVSFFHPLNSRVAYSGATLFVGVYACV